MTIVVSILVLLPWLAVGFLSKHKLRQFISAAFFGSLINIAAFQFGDYMGWWTTYQSFPPLGNIPTFVFGFSPVVALFIFCFAYPNLWLFLGANLVLDALQAYIVGPLVFEKLGFYEMTGSSDTRLYLVLISLVPLIYVYQLWYDNSRYTSDEIAGFPRLTGYRKAR
ncbi:hypothetical protein [Paenibacillus sp. YN15]|uniref:hypothetical protein n=1 Tax=Paenibacillus sp. YN15 TaxID=1742774 RepID=UPI000DCC03F5|nr:hypothetical protein [Paenibacillus sp. YN15]RAV05082.1 hypothetical protein DQG13_04165 [Paenibacillus sp. YN15]